MIKLTSQRFWQSPRIVDDFDKFPPGDFVWMASQPTTVETKSRYPSSEPSRHRRTIDLFVYGKNGQRYINLEGEKMKIGPDGKFKMERDARGGSGGSEWGELKQINGRLTENDGPGYHLTFEVKTSAGKSGFTERRFTSSNQLNVVDKETSITDPDAPWGA